MRAAQKEGGEADARAARKGLVDTCASLAGVVRQVGRRAGGQASRQSRQSGSLATARNANWDNWRSVRMHPLSVGMVCRYQPGLSRRRRTHVRTSVASMVRD